MPRQTAGMETREAPIGAAVRAVPINARGAALLETAVTLPIIVMIGVGIFEFGRTYQYPVSFILLDPAVRFVRPASTTGAPLTMSAVAIMRNES